MPETAPLTSPEVPNPEASKTSNSLIYFLIAVAVIILIGVGYWYFKINKPNQLVNVPQTASPLIATSSATPTQRGPNLPSNLPSKITVQSSSNGKIIGVIELQNSSDQSLSNLYYQLTLNTTTASQSAITINGVKTQLTARTIGVPLGAINSESFGVAPNGTKTLTFEMPFSSHLKNDTYRMAMIIGSKDGTKVSSSTTDVSLTGQGNYLQVMANSCSVVINNQTFNQIIAPPVSANQSAQGRCTFKNSTSQTLNLKYQTIYSVLNIVGYPGNTQTQSTSTDAVSFAPGETKDVTFTLPQISTPQVYEAWVSFIDNQNNFQSPPASFRFTVLGPSGRIEKITLDKDYYQQGQKANVSVVADSSMDLYWRNNPLLPGSANVGSVLANPTLQVNLTSADSAVCGQTNFSLPKNTSGQWGTLSIPVNINRNCLNPQVKVNLVDGNQTLASDSASITTTQKTSTNQFLNILQSLRKQLAVVATVLVIVVLFIILLIIFLKRGPKNSTPVTMIIILLLAGLFISANALIGQLRSTVLADIAYGAPGLYIFSSPNNYIALDQWQQGCDELHYPDCYAYATAIGSGYFYVNSVTSGSAAIISIYAPIAGGFCANTPLFWTATLNGSPIYLDTTYSTAQYGDTHGGYAYLPIQSTTLTLDPAPVGQVNIDFNLHAIQNGGDASSQAGRYVDLDVLEAFNPGFPYYINGVCYAQGACPLTPMIGRASYNFPPPTPQVPPVPIGLVNGNSNTCVGNSSTAAINWNASSGASYYAVYRNGAQVSTTTLTNYIDYPPSPNTNYIYTVAACTPQACSAQSAPINVTSSYCDTIPPTVSISGFPPAGKSCLTANDLVTSPASAIASDTGTNASGVRGVNFFVNDTSTNTNSSGLAGGYNGSSGLWTTDIRNASPSLIVGHIYTVSAQATDVAGNVSTMSAPSSKFYYDIQCVNPYLQTTGGDVHTNQTINATGGP